MTTRQEILDLIIDGKTGHAIGVASANGLRAVVQAIHDYSFYQTGALNAQGRIDRANRKGRTITAAMEEQLQQWLLKQQKSWKALNEAMPKEQAQECPTCACSPCDCEAQYAEVMEEQSSIVEDTYEVPFYDWGQ